MFRTIVSIDEAKCTGCGLCVQACHEGAIEIVNGKARLLRDDYCDGMGDCLPACPADAVRIERREAAAYDEAAVERRRAEQLRLTPVKLRAATVIGETSSPLENWPIQIRLVSPEAALPAGAQVLIAADCAGFACPDFHQRFMVGRFTLIGCPKLDAVDYAERLGRFFACHELDSVTVVRMNIPCCRGLERAVKAAAESCGKALNVETVVVSREGRILPRKE